MEKIYSISYALFSLRKVLKQIENFLKKHPQAHLKATPLASDGMLRLLPTESENNNALPKNHDGFFYALLNKRSKS